MKTIETLQEMAEWCALNAKDAESKANTLLHEGEIAQREAQERRRARHLKFTDALRDAIRRMKLTDRRKGFIPPALEDALEYAKEIGLPKTETESWHDHFNSNGWKVSGKTIMLDWQASLRNALRRYAEKKGAETRTITSTDPERWREFLKAMGLPAQQYRYAAAHRIAEFEQWLKTR